MCVKRKSRITYTTVKALMRACWRGYLYRNLVDPFKIMPLNVLKLNIVGWSKVSRR